MKFIFLWAMFLSSVAFGAWKQDRFIIGSYFDPPFYGDEAKDLKSLQQFKDAGFNTLSGLLCVQLSGRCKAPDGDLTASEWNSAGILNQFSAGGAVWEAEKIRFKRAAKIGGLRIFSAHAILRLYTEVEQSKIASTWYNRLNDQVFPASICPACRDAFEGYLIMDEPFGNDSYTGPEVEPHKDEIPNALNLVSGLKTYDQNSVSLINLFPNVEFFRFTDGNGAGYEAYVGRLLQGGVKVLSFDHYPFIPSPSGGVEIFGDYYKNHQIFADSCKKYGVPFFGFPLTQQHGIYAPITKSQLGVSVFVPVVYGAKGIVYFTYPSMYDFASIVNHDGSPNLNPAAPIYAWVQNYNRFLSRIGSAILGWNWLATVHGSSINNQIRSKYWPVQNEDYESGLPVISLSTPIIKGDLGNDRSYFAVGIFSGKASGESYLAILNKDIGSPRNVSISLKKQSRIYLTTAAMSSWSAKGKRSSFSLYLQPGEMQVVRLMTQSVSGNLIPMQ